MSAAVMPIRTTVSADATGIAASTATASGAAQRRKYPSLIPNSRFGPVLVQGQRSIPVPAAPDPKRRGIRRPRGLAAGRWAHSAHKTGKKKHAADQTTEGKASPDGQLRGENCSNRPE